MIDYGSKRERIMLCYPFEEKRLEKWNSPVIVQPKLDGVRCRAVWDGSKMQWTLYSSEVNEILGAPHVNSRLNELMPYGGLELDGELYTHGDSFGEIYSRTSRTVHLHEDFSRTSYHIFDLVYDAPQLARLEQLKKYYFDEHDLKRVEHEIVLGIGGVMREYQKILDNGYEGIVVRNILAPYVRRRSTYIMKFKPKKEDIYEIIGWKQEVSIEGVPKGRLGALLCQGDDGTEFAVGSGLTAAQRKDLWHRKEGLIGSFVKVEYQHITPGRGVPRFPVFVEVIEKTWEEE